MNDEQFIKHLQGDDELGAVIRAHIYIEYFTDQIIELVVAKPQKLKPLNLDFDGKVNLLMALGVDPVIKKPLSVLGGMRNKFAHRPNYKLTKSEVKNLYESLNSKDKELVHECYKELTKKYPELDSVPKFKNLNPKETFVLLALAVRGVILSVLNDIKGTNA